jgi:transposase
MSANTTAEALPTPGATEVLAVPLRRRFSAAFKQKVIQEVEARQRAGLEIGSVLRREGLYSSHLSKWRQAEEAHGAEGLEPRKPGPKPDPERAYAADLERLRRENARLAARLERAELIIDVQKKVSQMLGLELPPEPPSL